MKQSYRYFPLYFIASLFCSVPAYTQWAPAPMPEGGEVFFLEYYANAYWAGANSGLYRSANGLQWEHVDNLGFNPFVAALVDADTMYLVQNEQKTEVLTTTDGGQSWKKTTAFPEKSAFNPRLYKSGDVLVISNAGPFLYYLKSADNGNSFQGFQGGQQDLNGGLFDANGGIMAYFFSYFYLSVDGGATFSWQLLPANHNEALRVLTTDSAIVVRSQLNSGPPEVFISFDTAKSWQTMALPAGFTPSNSTLNRQGKRGLLLLKSDAFAISNDHGLSWQTFTTPIPPRRLLQTADGWFISTFDGFFHSTDSGANWSGANEGFRGHVLTRLFQTAGHLYAYTSQKKYYYSPFGSDTWYPLTTAKSVTFPTLAFAGEDTLVFYNQISFDRGQTWTDINYPNVNAFGVQNIAIHDGHAYVPNRDKLQVVPLVPMPTAQPQSFPGGDDAMGVLFAGDTLFLLTEVCQVFRRLPGSSTWDILNQASSGAFLPRIFRVQGRFFVTRGVDLLYSDDGINWQPFPTDRFPWTTSPVTYFQNMVGVDSVIVAASAEAGLMFSTNRGADWWRFQTGMPQDLGKATGLAVGPGHLYAAMYQGGLWQRKLQLGSATGLVYRDDNKNGVRDTGESPLPNVRVLASGSDNLAVTDSAGQYQIWFDAHSDSVSVLLPAAYGAVQPPKRFVGGVKTGQDFGVWFQPGAVDVGVQVVNTSIIRPGYDHVLVVLLENKGGDVQGTTVSLTLPPGIEFLSANPAPVTITGDSITWTVSGMTALERLSFSVICRADNLLLPGDMLSFSAEALLNETDLYPDDNLFHLTTNVLGSYDPNDKQVQPAGPLSPAQLAAGTALHYTIRFQNTGNYRADRVRLIDTLDKNLDLQSLRITGASHPFIWRLLDGRVLEVIFDHILLPDSSSDEAGSHGFFSFSISGERDLPLGARMTNRALIYFDFNAPIITNTVVTEIKLGSDAADVNTERSIMQLSPNPAGSHCFVTLPESGGSATLFRWNGTVVHWKRECPAQIAMDVRELPAGLYLLYWEKGANRASSVLIVAR